MLAACAASLVRITGLSRSAVWASGWAAHDTWLRERVIGTLRRELLDRTLILGECHLDPVLREYLIHYNRHRPHQSRQRQPPDIETQSDRDVADLRSVRRRPVVVGLINEYHHAA
jgi:putative transposase